MATATLRNLDPPMHHAPFPAGFPLTRESPRILGEGALTDRSITQQIRKELAEQEPRYETGVPPYPSGFPRQGVVTITPRTPGSRGLARIERKYLYEKNDPVSSEPSRDYLTAYAEKEVRERLQRATPPADRYIVTAPAEPAGTTQVVQKWWVKTQGAIHEAEALGKIVQERLEEATHKASLSNRLKRESDNARQLEVEARNEARDTPGKARLAVIRIKEELADAKADVIERTREAAEDDLKKVQYDRESKMQEAKVVTKAARIKRAELNDLERLLARIETVRREAGEAEMRADQVSVEVRNLVEILNEKQKALEEKLDDLNRIRAQINQLAQEYSAAVSEHETADAVVARNMKIAESLKREAEQKRNESIKLAHEWDEAKKAAQEAAQKEVEIWKRTREAGAEEERLVVDVTEKLEAPLVSTERERAGEQLTPRPLQDIEHDGED
ncbi:hypothetical protein COCSUDRAFT_39389 [Coccomyxa subellipsoidea C-169]|uniref:Uncharacterized protein n=1 Tax=Coccomyxa subellipsoidea (strain C-169) TaxID=574566 RepID=I0Z6H5_COCSC|nr:hypothetical protein COCSUDRAFT_39389 [Coccomyxa subellipsoidea C-169]EIE26244.1 hypothetical protein COCSUDRAFT_39389 [Coccomyxa subellipsoidea C-169]|eukprot:XP_005650788.1 hypothetical protein COCSUDRAFT_39389 [Coccomyxa subellipsoidea C-169]